MAQAEDVKMEEVRDGRAFARSPDGYSLVVTVNTADAEEEHTADIDSFDALASTIQMIAGTTDYTSLVVVISKK